MTEGGAWLQRARLFEAQGVFNTADPSFYQSRVHAALLLHKQWDKEDDLMALLEGIFVVVAPDRYKIYKEKREKTKEEQLGFERINYEGEGDKSWRELEKDFEGMDLSVLGFGSNEIKLTGEGLGEVLRKYGHESG